MGKCKKDVTPLLIHLSYAWLLEDLLHFSVGTCGLHLVKLRVKGAWLPYLVSMVTYCGPLYPQKGGDYCASSTCSFEPTMGKHNIA